MPHHPSEEEASSHVFDQVAKESKDSTASDHPIHADTAKASVQDHQSKGPQIPESKSSKVAVARFMESLISYQICLQQEELRRN